MGGQEKKKKKTKEKEKVFFFFGITVRYRIRKLLMVVSYNLLTHMPLPVFIFHNQYFQFPSNPTTSVCLHGRQFYSLSFHLFFLLLFLLNTMVCNTVTKKDWRQNTACRMFALYSASGGSIPCIPYMIPESIRSNF